jgi:hypothetical protein
MPRDPYDIYADDIAEGFAPEDADAHAFRGVPCRRSDPEDSDYEPPDDYLDLTL